MANNDAPFGFRLWGECLRANIYAVQTAPTINVFTGDMVHGGLTAINTAKFGYLPIIEDANIIPATPGGTAKIMGSVLACFDENMIPCSYIAATEVGDGTTAGYVLLADHPDQMFYAQEDADTTPIAAANLMQNYDIYSPALSAGNTYTGLSKQEIDSSSVAVTVTLALKVIKMAYPGQDSLTGVAATQAGCRWVCQVNNACHFLGSSQAAL